MALKKTEFKDDEEALFDNVVIYKRGEYWHMRMWLLKEHKYARFSLKTRNKATAIDKAETHYFELKLLEKTGKTYFSKTTKMGVEMYLEERLKDVATEIIVKGRYSTIRTHLNHFLSVIGKDTKLKELERTDLENYFYERTKTKKSIPISQTTVENEQSIINAMMKWLYKRGETYIDGFDFKKLKRVDRGVEANRRGSFEEHEIEAIKIALAEYIAEAEKDIKTTGNLSKAVTGYYLGFSLVSGLRRGEQLQLRWCDVEDFWDKNSHKKPFELIRVTVRGETSKVRRTRKMVVRDFGFYYSGLMKLRRNVTGNKVKEVELRQWLGEELIFTTNGKTPITPRAIGYHFDRVIERAGITHLDKRDLVPYSFRHYFITQKVNSRIPVADIAEMCGTSITQIEKTYYHTTEAKMISNALADYDYVDGVLVPKAK